MSMTLAKLTDRLHNMGTLEELSSTSRRRIARETLDIYAPMAGRLGMTSMKSDLENFGFANLHPWRYRIIAKHLDIVTGYCREIVETIKERLTTRMNEAGVPCRISGRRKTPYSVYRKMLDKRVSFFEVADICAFRIITPSELHCYEALGIVHRDYSPKPGRFKDYIALPKANGYQSLHTIVNSPHGLPIEIQIRSEEMDVVAETGAAAHWQYKHEVRPRVRYEAQI